MYQSQLNQGPFSKWKFRFTPIETTVKNHFDQKVLTALQQIAETLTSLGNDFRVHRSSKIVNSEEFTNESRELLWNRHCFFCFWRWLSFLYDASYLPQQKLARNFRWRLKSLKLSIARKRLSNFVRSYASKTLYKFIISRRFWLDTIRSVITKRKLGYYIISRINSKLRSLP